MKIRTFMGIAAALGAVGLITLAQSGLLADEVSLVGTEKEVTALIKADIADLQKALSPAKPERKDIKRAKVLAMVIALNAKALGGKGESAAIAEQALKVAEALAKEDGLAEAKEAAKALTTAKTATGASGDVVKAALFDNDPTVKDWDRDLAMQLFKTPRAGGLGIESKIKAWAEKAPVGKDTELAANFAQKVGVIGQALQAVAPPSGKGADEWKKLATDMQTASQEAVAAAAKKDGKAMMAAFGRIDKACTVCHEKFK